MWASRPDRTVRGSADEPHRTREEEMRRRTRLLVVAAALGALAAGGLYGGVLAELGPVGASRHVPAIDADTVLSGFGRDHGAAATVARLETELQTQGEDPERLSELGL